MNPCLAHLTIAAALAIVMPLAAAAEEVDAYPGARVGDWIEFRNGATAQFGIESSTRQVVKEITADEIVLEMTTRMSMGGKEMPSQTQVLRQPRKHEVDPAAKQTVPGVEVLERTIQAADGKSYACKGYASEQQGKKAIAWLSEDLPLGGMVLTEVDGRPAMEMTGWGRGK